MAKSSKVGAKGRPDARMKGRPLHRAVGFVAALRLKCRRVARAAERRDNGILLDHLDTDGYEWA